MKIMVVDGNGILEAEYDHPAVLPDAVIVVDGHKGTISGKPVIVQREDPEGGSPWHEVEFYEGQSTSIDDLLQS